MPLYLKDKMVSGISLGVPGKSAYEQAKEGGYTGTEEEFAEILANAATKDYVDEAIGEIPTPDVSGQIDTHNTDSSAHADIRTALNGKAPAGYGLGGSIGTVGADIPKNADGAKDFNKAIDTGWYWVYPHDTHVNCPDVDYIGYTTMLVERYRHVVQTLYVNYQKSVPVVWRRMSHVDDTENWYPWECISHTYGTTDLTAGSSPLANGQLYFVYE